MHCWELLLLLLLLLLLRHGMGGGVHQVTPNGIASTCLCDTRLLECGRKPRPPRLQLGNGMCCCRGCRGGRGGGGGGGGGSVCGGGSRVQRKRQRRRKHSRASLRCRVAIHCACGIAAPTSAHTATVALVLALSCHPLTASARARHSARIAAVVRAETDAASPHGSAP